MPSEFPPEAIPASPHADGGPAFPSPGITMPDGTQPGAHAGMSLRDYFASQALAGMLHDPGKFVVSGHAAWGEAVVAGAFRLADAMVAERAK